VRFCACARICTCVTPLCGDSHLAIAYSRSSTCN
jgi:hypothetical protein